MKFKLKTKTLHPCNHAPHLPPILPGPGWPGPRGPGPGPPRPPNGPTGKQTQAATDYYGKTHCWQSLTADIA